MIKKSSSRNIVIACAGNSPGGELSDRLARRLQKKKLAQMFSIAQITTRIDVSSNVCLSENVIAINGCPLACSSECLRKLNYTGFKECNIKDIGNPHRIRVNDETLGICFKKIKKSLLS